MKRKTKLFYQKLAFNNIKNNGKTYIPYLITCIGTILMFYNMISLTLNSNTGDGSTFYIMSLGTAVTAVFSSIFIFYTNSFLVKRRKREFGLYNVLGMEKKHISHVMFWENTIIGTASLFFGILFGILFSKLMTLLMIKILHLKTEYAFEVNIKAVIITTLLFATVFLLNLLNAIKQVYLSKPVELLQGGIVGEKEPKSNILLAIFGVATLGAGYYIALSVGNPLSALKLFFVAVILVILGTYSLFTAGSVVVLKLLRKNKNYYYKTKNFVSVSSMIYRMKKNAVGLSNICIMSTAVLVMISTTVSMYIGIKDVMNQRYPEDVLITKRNYEPEERQANNSYENYVKDILKEDKVSYENLKGYEYLNVLTIKDGNKFMLDKSTKYQNTSGLSMLVMITKDDFNKFTNKDIKLSKDEVVILSENKMNNINIFGKEYKVKNVLKESPIGEFSTYLFDVIYVVVDSKSVVDEFYHMQKEFYNESAEKLTYDISFDFKMSDDEVVKYSKETLVDKITKNHLSIEVKQLNTESFYIMYGGLFFLGIFLGFLFTITMILIIYYKQVVEGYEDKERFKIMQKIGMSKEEVKKSINSQILTVFSLPLIIALIHVIVAFPILTKLLEMLNMTNAPLFGICTLVSAAVFAIFYAIVYLSTSRIYYKIVND